MASIQPYRDGYRVFVHCKGVRDNATFRTRAKLAGFTFHDSRHTAATWMAQKLHVLDLCKVFGWSNIKRALTYFNPTASDIAKRMQHALA